MLIKSEDKKQVAAMEQRRQTKKNDFFLFQTDDSFYW